MCAKIIHRDVEGKSEFFPHLFITIDCLECNEGAVELCVKRPKLIREIVPPQQLIEKERCKARLNEYALIQALPQHSAKKTKALEMIHCDKTRAWRG